MIAAVTLSLLACPAASAAHRPYPQSANEKTPRGNEYGEMGEERAIPSVAQKAVPVGSGPAVRWSSNQPISPVRSSAPVSERGKQLVDSFGAAPTSSLSAARPMSEKAAPRSETCPDARRGLTWYRAHARSWAHKMGAAAIKEAKSARRLGCPQIHRAVTFWRAKAHANRLKYERWFLYAWRDWMPPFWKCIARWEESYDFSYRSSVYTSVFAIIRSEYDADAARMGAPPWRVRHTPRDQYRAALGHQARFGLDGWGSLGRCR